jgi:hypothetical protein
MERRGVVFQVGKLASHAAVFDPDARAFHRDIVFHTASHQAGAAINTARRVN